MTNSIQIKEISAKKDIKKFIMFPWKIYRGAKKVENWVPPLLLDEKAIHNQEKNPFYKHAQMQRFLAYKGNEIVGRIAAIIDDNYVEFQKDSAGFFGFFEAIDDIDVARGLFESAKNWIKERKMKRMIGPMNPSTNHILGVLIDSFDRPPFVQMNYNMPYYIDLYEKSGLTKEKDLYCYIMETSLKLSDKILRVAELAKKRNRITIRSFNMKKFDREVKIAREIYNQAWSKNWGFVPWTEEEFDHMAEDLKLIAIPELALFAYIDDEPVGVSIPLPDINEILIKMNGRVLPTGLFKLILGKNKVKYLRIAILGVKHDYQNKGIDAIFVAETYKRGEAMGFSGGEISWVYEDNMPLRNLVENWGAKHYRTYRVYRKKV